MKRRTVELPASSLSNTDNFRVDDKTESKVDDIGSQHKCIEKISVEDMDDATTDDESPRCKVEEIEDEDFDDAATDDESPCCKVEESICLEKPSFKVPFFNMDDMLQMIDTTGEAADDDEDAIIKRCKKVHEKCGHRCCGVADEAKCLPCLDSACANPAVARETSDELCAVCYTSELGAQSCVQLTCGHIFHADCILQLLKHRWSTLKVSFAFLACPSCKAEISEDIQSELIRNEVIEIKKMKLEVET